MSSFDLFGNPTSDHLLDGDDDSPTFYLSPGETGEVISDEVAPSRNFTGITVFMVAVVSILCLQCFNLQITQGSVNRALAEGNSIRILTLQPDRGLITDLNGKILAQNSRNLALAIDPQKLPAKRIDRIPIYAKLQKDAAIPDETIALIEENRLKSPEIFPIKPITNKEEALLYREHFGTDTPGVVLQEIPIRYYTPLSSMGQLLGYVGIVDEEDRKNGFGLNQRIGKQGLEKQYQNELAGVPGKQKAEVNAFGEVVRTLSSEDESSPTPGKTLRLSLDSNLQKITAEALQHEIERRNKKFGQKVKNLGASAVVLDPATGAIKAMVSLPDYDPQTFGKGITTKDYSDLLKNPGNPLLNRAIQGQYPPGSTIKPLMASAGLQGKVITESTSMFTPDAIYVGNFRFPDWTFHGQTNTRKAIAESNNVFFYRVGGGDEKIGFRGLGIDKMNEFLTAFGLSETLGVYLPGESAVFLGTPEWKKKRLKEQWYIGDTYHASIGQGFTLVTPLQMAAATASIVNGGTLWQPKLGWSLIDSTTGKEELLPHQVIHKDFISAKNLQTVREGMRMTVESGSARLLKNLKVTSAGKTGTAQFGNQGMTHAWYVGFAPYENPELVFAVVIEGGGESFWSSVPVVEEILRNYFGEPLNPGQKLFSDPSITGDPFVKQEPPPVQATAKPTPQPGQSPTPSPNTSPGNSPKPTASPTTPSPSPSPSPTSQ